MVSCGSELVSVGFGVGGSGSCGFGMVIAVSKMVIAFSELVIANMRIMKTTLEPKMWSVISVLRFTHTDPALSPNHSMHRYTDANTAKPSRLTRDAQVQ